MSIRIPDHIQNLKPYKPGRPIADVMQQYGLEHVVKLASNENPLGPSPKAVEEMRKTLWDMQYYPNGGRTIRDAIAAKHGLDVGQVIAGSGSEGVMNTFMRTFFEAGDEVVTSEGTFTGFYVLAAAIGLNLVMAPMKDFGYDLDAILERVTSNTRLVYLANPNNPTGRTNIGFVRMLVGMRTERLISRASPDFGRRSSSSMTSGSTRWSSAFSSSPTT